MSSRLRVAAVACLSLLPLVVAPVPARAQAPPRRRQPRVIADNPPPPVAPDVIRREGGRATVRAVRLTEPLRVDGRLDEEVYRTVPAITDFIQNVPTEGAISTERTEAWILYDADTLYIVGRCWDSAPPEKWVANELRRDTNQLRQNDHFGALLDTFHDKRNGFFFYVNPLGARADTAVTDEGNNNSDWNPVWEARTSRFDGGWTAELAIPFKSLRYVSGVDQIWGLQLRRSIRRKNEWTHLTALPAADGGPSALTRVSAAANLVGLELPAAGKNIEIKPYIISSLTTDRLQSPPLARDLAGNAGLDFKYGVTANLTADVTVNTDFAQVEADEQQVNLTRFSLVLPEKRDFFLEGRGVFDFARWAGSGSATTSTTPSLFYSRRIGLNAGRIVPIEVGGRLTGKAGRYGIGLMNIQTADESTSSTPSTNFSVLRVKRDILRRSSIGAIFTNRSHAVAGTGDNQAAGVDAAISLYENVNLNAYYAKTSTDGLAGDSASYQGRFEYGGDRYGARAEYLVVGDNFNPEVGFVRRDNFARSFGSLRFSPRPTRMKTVRKFTYEGNLEYIENGAGALETRNATGRMNVEFQNSDQFTAQLSNEYERLVRPFAIARGATIPVGGYNFNDVVASYLLGQQRRVSGQLSVQHGTFYDGTLTALGYSGARVSVTTRFSMEPSVSVNRVRLDEGNFTNTVLRARSDYGFSPLMFASALVQYSSSDHTFSSNLRFRWEYSQGSELFVVYTDEHDTLGAGAPVLKNRAVVVKVNRLLRF